ncbi:MAG: gamma-glutamyltransferase [Gemmatimonadota bacterium]|jgi:gamma-glutamyltranspeptidase/glutathione hydrolase
MHPVRRILLGSLILSLLLIASASEPLAAQRPQKPILHGKHWVAITGKPMAATAGSMMFVKGGNAVDAACAMLAATATMWDVLSWGGETQALIFNPNTGRVIAINALGVAPTGATADLYREKGYRYPPETGVLAAVTPGTPGGLMTMLAEYGTLSLAEVLEPAMVMAEGYPMEADAIRRIISNADEIREWPYSRALFFTHPDDEENPAPREGEIFRQPDLRDMLGKLVETERDARAGGMSRKEAIYAAYDRFYRGDIAQELVRSTREQGGLFTMEDLDRWQVHIEEPVSTSYKGIEVYKLTSWVQGPVMLQELNMLESVDLKAMGFNSARYLHTLYQVMNHAFADRDFYYGDPYFPPDEPMEGLLSKEYARSRLAEVDWSMNDPDVRPGDPYAFMDASNPFTEYLRTWTTTGERRSLNDAGHTMGEIRQEESSAPSAHPAGNAEPLQGADLYDGSFYAGTTSIQAADEEGWVVSVTPSGGWVPAVIAGTTGVGLSQRAQSFVLDPADNPFNVIVPGKRPRATLTPGLAMKDGRPFLSFAVQGGDSQDQNLLQFFLNVVEWGMNVQQAAEAPNMNSYQMRGSFAQHESEPGRMLLNESVPPWVRDELRAMGYTLTFSDRTSGPINAVFFDWEHGSFWGGSSNHGDDYGVVW